MNLKQTLLMTAVGDQTATTVYVPFPTPEVVVNDKGKPEKLIPNSLGLIRIFLVGLCLVIFSMQGLNAQANTFQKHQKNHEMDMAALKVKVLLSGPMIGDTGNGTMRDDLWQQHLLPGGDRPGLFTKMSNTLGQPAYPDQRNYLAVQEQLDKPVQEGRWQPQPALGYGVVDWMTLELLDPLDETNVLARAQVALLQDGTLVDESGSATLSFPGLPAEYYLVAVRHCNHLGALTARPVYLGSKQPPTVDFTDPALELVGGDGATALMKGRRCLWAGDLNGDGKVIFQGPSNDVMYLFSKVMTCPANRNNLANFVVAGYEPEDLNLDGKIIYQGPNNDKTALLYHAVLMHPGNTHLLANFIVEGALP